MQLLQLKCSPALPDSVCFRLVNRTELVVRSSHCSGYNKEYVLPECWQEYKQESKLRGPPAQASACFMHGTRSSMSAVIRPMLKCQTKPWSPCAKSTAATRNEVCLSPLQLQQQHALLGPEPVQLLHAASWGEPWSRFIPMPLETNPASSSWGREKRGKKRLRESA